MDEYDAGGDNEGAHGEARSYLPRNIPPLITEADFVNTQYNMDHSSRGFALIINQHKKRWRNHFDEDTMKMFQLLIMLGFKTGDIEIKENLEAEEIKKELARASEKDYTNRSCFVCVILCLGGLGFVYDSKDNKIPLDELTLPFKGDHSKSNKSLVGKPKLFFIQASEIPVVEAQAGWTPVSALEEPAEKEIEEEVIVRRIPSEADFLVAFSFIPCLTLSSWFVEALSQVFSAQHKTTDVLTMLTRVNKLVSHKFEQCVADNDRINKRLWCNKSWKTLTPCATSMLTKDLYFSQ